MDIVAVIAAVIKNIALSVLGMLMALGAHVTAITTPPPAGPEATAPTATTTATVVQVFPTAGSSKPAATTTPATTTSKPAAATPAPKVTSGTVAIDGGVLNTQTRAALVNVLCTTKAGGAIEPISGSGVVIDNRGVVLTNAHVGQFFLLRDWETPDNIDCVIRTGSPAVARYHAELLYLPPAWVAANASQLKASQASGTGENDYSLLLITSATDGSPLPASFPHVAMSTVAPDVGDEMLLAAYPAGFLSGQLISSQLYASSAFAYVTQLFTYSDTKYVDLFSVGGTIESQAGSSGGVAVRLDGTLSGIITTATLSGSTGERDLRAITLAHINRSLATEGKGGLADILSGDLSAEAKDFDTNVAPDETAALEKVLNSQ